MRRRFGRGRRGKGGAESKNQPIDATRIFEQIAEAGITPAAELAPVDTEEIPEHFAAVAEGTDADGGAVLVGFAPRSGGDAALAVVAEAERRTADGFSGEAIAVAPQWSGTDRRRLALLSPQGYRLRAVAASALGDTVVQGEVAATSALIPARQIAGSLASSTAREVFLRALAAFEGLAAKHGGAVRGARSRVELVLLARCSAVLTVGEGSRGQDAAVVLETILPERSSETLEASSLAKAMDRLEGLLRKRLNDRRIRGGEEGLRNDLIPTLAASAGLLGAVPWPLGGADPDVIDLAGIGEEGQPVLGAVRERLTLPTLGAILDAVASLGDSLPTLFADLDVPWRWMAPRIVLAANGYDAPALRVLSALTLDNTLFDVSTRRGRSSELVRRAATPRDGVAAAPTAELAAPTPRTPRPAREIGEPRESRSPRADRVREEDGEPRRDRAPNRRRRRGGSRTSSASDADATPEAAVDTAEEPREAAREEVRGRSEEESAAPQFDEVSLFDLDMEERSSDDSASGTRRRRRGRRRRPRVSREGSEGDSQPQDDPGAEEDDARSPRAVAEPQDESALVDDEDTVDDIADLADTLSDVDEEPDPDARPEPAYDDEEDEGASGALAAAAGDAPKEAPEAQKRTRPRRRAAILAHADRASVLAAVLLARDLRLLEGIWVYPQTDLMTFFRSVATDLGNDTPIYVVGFNASPAREVLQAVALYADRLDWFDHHDWPPEDLGALRDVIGDDRAHVYSGMGSSLSAVLSECTRRSRFSDKLVELLTGRFSDHDYERWGRYWWVRLGEIAAQTGDRRADLESLLVGRPSDLAREAELLPVPAFPAEVEFVSARDFRLVHFGGYTLVMVPTPAELDDGLAARIARERYSAQLSLAYHEGQETISLGTDEGRGGNRGFNLSSLVDHLASKHDWVEALPDEDRVASLRVRGLFSVEGRLDEIVREIAMGRSLLES